MEFRPGKNSYVNFSLVGRKIHLISNHDIIDSTVIFENSDGVFYTYQGNLRKRVNQWFLPSQNIFEFKSFFVKVFDSGKELIDIIEFKDPKFDIMVDLVSNQIKVIHLADSKVLIKVTDLKQGLLICQNQINFEGCQIFWHRPSRKLTQISEIRVEVFDMIGNLLIQKDFYLTDFDYTFCHIPKNAGSSIIKYLNNNAGHSVVDKSKTNSFVCAFVRNPYDRVISAYSYLKYNSYGGNLLDFEKFIGDSSLSEFITKKLEFVSKNQIHFLPQNYWIPNGADFIGRYENLEEDFNRLLDTIGIARKTLPVVNKSNRESHILTEGEREIIYQIYKEDFIKFGYTK